MIIDAVTALLFVASLPAYAAVARVSWHLLKPLNHEVMYVNPTSVWAHDLLDREEYLRRHRLYPKLYPAISKAHKAVVPCHCNELLAVCWPVIPVWLMIRKLRPVFLALRQIDERIGSAVGAA